MGKLSGRKEPRVCKGVTNPNFGDYAPNHAERLTYSSWLGSWDWGESGMAVSQSGL